MQVKNKTGRDNLLDFSASLNPYPPVTGWDPSEVSLCEYPDDSYIELKESIADVFKCRPEEICVGNGSIEVIRSYFKTVLDEGDRVLIDKHTFGEYGLSVSLADGKCTINPAERYNVRVICNPNNPTGSLLKKDRILDYAFEEKKKGNLLFIDEAFMDLCDMDETLIGAGIPEIFVSRSITKSFSVPGLRFGFGFGDPDLIEKIEIVRTPWTINSYASSFCLYAMKHYGELEESKKRIRVEKEWLYERLCELGLEFGYSYANYILVRCPYPASVFTDAMLNHGIYVRDCTSFRLPDHIRIAVRTRDENKILMEAMESCLH